MVTPVEPKLVETADQAQGEAMVWQFGETVMALSSAPVGGGLGPIEWVVNIGVDKNYARTDLENHVAEVAEKAGLSSAGTLPAGFQSSATEPAQDQHRGAGLLTAAWLKNRQFAEQDSLRVDATVGVSKPTWAAQRHLGLPADDEPWRPDRWRPGTINIVAQLPVALEPAAAVNAIATITEAKTQALLEGGVHGTGTASDAIVLCWPAAGKRERFGGTRSEWGSILANVTYDAVTAGLPPTAERSGSA